MSECEWCAREVRTTWWVRDGDDEVRVCQDCRNDYLYALSGGRIPQEPAMDRNDLNDARAEMRATRGEED